MTILLLAAAVLAFSLVGVLALGNPRLRFFLLLGTMYLESTPFSFESPIGRIRPNIVVVGLVGIGTVVDYLLTRKSVRMVATSWLLAAYVGANAVSFTRAENASMSLRVLLLLVGWLTIQVGLTTYCSTERRTIEVIRWFLGFGVLQAIIGIAQMLGTFERPTGTIGSGDSDYFALAMLGTLLIFHTLQLLRVEVFGRRRDQLISIVLVINIFFSFVRSSWIGYLFGLLALAALVLSGRLGKFSSQFRRLAGTMATVGLTTLVAFAISPKLQEYFFSRISLEETGGYSIKENMRLVLMAASWEHAMERPILGNGPGAFTAQGQLLNVEYSRNIAFDPSIVTTIMNDTGVVGTCIFLVLVGVTVGQSLAALGKAQHTQWGRLGVAFSVAIFGLLMAYVMTNGLWLPFSWIFFSLGPICSGLAKEYASSSGAGQEHAVGAPHDE